jgi:diadenosine tetraphosphate (Ap4A) HIT family hydrolase
MSEKTIFSKIIDREIPGHFVYEDDICVVIMDIYPSVPGQVMVIPKEPVAYVFDLPNATYVHIMNITKLVAKALDTVFNTSRTCIVVEGFEVPHTHIKLFPLALDETALTNVLMYTAPADLSELEKQRDLIKVELTK